MKVHFVRTTERERERIFREGSEEARESLPEDGYFLGLSAIRNYARDVFTIFAKLLSF